MAILFAAPFILLAGTLFTVLSLIPGARRWAIPIPTGIIGAEPASLVGLMVSSMVMSKSPRPGGGSMIAFRCAGALTGLVGGFFAGAIARFLTSVLPAVLLRMAVFVAAGCSYFVLIAGALFFLDLRSGYSSRAGWPIVAAILSLEALLSFIGAWFIALRSEGFRSRRIRLPYGTSFRDRGRRECRG